MQERMTSFSANIIPAIRILSISSSRLPPLRMSGRAFGGRGAAARNSQSRGRGRGVGGGRGGEQRWWDPVWRAQKLNQIRGEGPKQETLDENEWWEELEGFRNNEKQEIIIKRNFGREDVRILEDMAIRSGFHFRTYNKGRNTVHVVSKIPLPNYRPDLDEKHGTSQREIKISTTTEAHLENVLAQMKASESRTNVSLGLGRQVPKSAVVETDEYAPKLLDSFRKEEENSRLKAYQFHLQNSSAAKAMQSFREKLPAFQMREKVLKVVKENQVVVISGETGCGKTTQLPQFILENEIECGRGMDCSIICTQPRRISAISVASRVAMERGDSLGEIVGYQIRLESKRSLQTRLLFCTTGVLLRRLVKDPKLQGVSHVVVDEIHERGMNEDFLLIVLRNLICQRPNLHLILMSATINAEAFSKYFNQAPMLHIPGYTFPVRELFLEDILQLTGYCIPNEQSGHLSSTFGRRRKCYEKIKDPVTAKFDEIDFETQFKAYSRSTRMSLEAYNGDAIDLDLIEATIQHICRSGDEGAVLVFLTGWDDISKMLDKLKGNPLLGNRNKFLLLPLHGSMPTVNQQEIFQRPPIGVRKVVLATNIAETSITIDDVVYVIDCGKSKETSYDALNKVACLTPSWISQASAQQRRGRAGRVQPGICYHIYPKVIYDAMPKYQLPEILRTPLESLCIQIKSLGLGLVANFLSQAMQPPEALAVHNAISLLKEIGALDFEENLTPLGRHLATLPLDPKVGKMLLMGAIFRCIEPALTIAAALAHRDPFVLPIERKEEADEARRWFAGDSRSDHMAIVNAFNKYLEAKRQGVERNYCWKNYLSLSTLQWMESARCQFYDLLGDIGFVDKKLGFKGYNNYGDDLEMVRAILCAGLFPNVVRCTKRGKRTIFHTKDDGKVEPHPSSVNSRVSYFPYPYLVYSDKVKTTAIYLRDSSNISDYALLMFGGSLVSNSDGHVEMLNGYLNFLSASPSTMRIVNDLRQRLDHLLQHKIEDPKFDVCLEGKDIVNAVIQLLHSGQFQRHYVEDA